MFQQTYYVDKQTGTFADVCAAYGLAVVLDSILEQGLGIQKPRTVRIVDVGTTYAIELMPPLRPEWVEGCQFLAPIPFIRTEKNRAKMPKGIPEVDYAKHKAGYDRYKELRNALRKTMDTEGADETEADAALREAKPVADFFVWQKINMMSAVSAYNDAVSNWYANRNQFAELLKLLLTIHARTPNAVEEGETKWKSRFQMEGKQTGAQGKSKGNGGVFTGKATTLSLLQVWNPGAGKGQNAPKPNRLAMENVDGFWLCEYLKMTGFYQCAVPRFVLARQGGGKPPKSRKTFALAPVNISLAAHQAIFDSFRESLRSSSAVKLDILAALHYTDCFLQHCEAAASEDLALELFGKAPENFVAGLHTTFYKDLGNSSAVMNLSFISLPHWLEVKNAGDVRLYRDVLGEHTNVIRGLKQDVRDAASEGGEEHALLSSYRDFLSANDVTAFFDFSAGYAGYLMSAIERDRSWVRPLQQSNLEVMLMHSEPKLKPIIDNEGFQNIARAIRQSTVTLQYMAKKGKPPYDIRYGLGQELKRRANYAQEFIITLSEFLQSFNAENARVSEVSSPGRHWRKSVREDDINEVIRLIDEHGAPVVAHLLLAFGYASASKEDDSVVTDDSLQDVPGGVV